MKNRPCGMVSSGGDLGGERGQQSLRLIGAYHNVKFMEKPNLCVKRYSNKYFD